MRLNPEQLDKHLREHLLPLYVISGDEPLQREEALDTVRAAARAQGFDERTVHHVDRRFDWNEIAHFGDALSLFASRRILELRLNQKVDDAGRKALSAFVERLPQDVVTLLVLAYRVDGQTARTKWFSALERAGAHVQVWPVAPAQMPRWVQARARRAGLRVDDDAAALLAERGEGNLLACAQEVAKLALLYPGVTVGVDHVLEATADSARYDAFDLIDACFRGEAARTVRIVRALRDEGYRVLEPLGPLAWAIRSAAEVAARVAGGAAVEAALGPQHAAWRAPQRLRALESALRRHPPGRWERLLVRAARIDLRAKGHVGRLVWRSRGEPLQAWDELEVLALALCGVSLARPGPYNRGPGAAPPDRA